MPQVFEHTMETITQESTTKIISTDTARVKWLTEGVEMMKFGQVTPRSRMERIMLAMSESRLP